MFISYKKGIKLDGANPTLLYGYGGFNISLPPMFAVGRVAWMEMGGVYAQPNLRGGGEYGEAWHKAGTKLQKQNVFDDFIAAAEWLIAASTPGRDRLAIQGGSNGGLLVGAVMTQRPDLFGCLPAGGRRDGHAPLPEVHRGPHLGRRLRLFRRRSASSSRPCWHTRPTTTSSRAPAIRPTLVTTADTDDRVVPGHSFKFAAALQRAQACDSPVLIRIDTRAGHGGGKPTSKRIEQVTDEFAFVVKSLKMKGPAGSGIADKASAAQP